MFSLELVTSLTCLESLIDVIFPFAVPSFDKAIFEATKTALLAASTVPLGPLSFSKKDCSSLGSLITSAKHRLPSSIADIPVE